MIEVVGGVGLSAVVSLVVAWFTSKLRENKQNYDLLMQEIIRLSGEVGRLRGELERKQTNGNH